MQISLEGKRALICGGTQGIGTGIAKCMASAGAEVILASRSEERAMTVASSLDGSNHGSIVLDQEDKSSIIEAAKAIKDLKVDIIVNNTGGPDPGQLINEDWNNFEKAITKQLFCSQTLTVAAVVNMKQRQYGRVINIISTSVKIPIPGLAVSNTLRGAMASWSKTLAEEVAPFGITVNNLLPGFIETNRLKQIITTRADNAGVKPSDVEARMLETIPARRFGTAEDMGNIATFLVSEFAGYVTGTSICVDGGKTGAL